MFVRLVLCIFMVLFLSGCGVDTDSSARGGTADTNQTTDDPDDSNTTDPTDPTDPGDDLGDPNEDQSRSDFDTRSAVKDQNACLINTTYNGMADSSFDPTGTVDAENGIIISSLYPYNADVQKTQVTVYYPDLIATLAGSQSTIYADKYRVNFDQSWPANTNKTIYVRTPRGIDSNYYGCMRYTLSLDTASIVGQRVYRVNE